MLCSQRVYNHYNVFYLLYVCGHCESNIKYNYYENKCLVQIIVYVMLTITYIQNTKK